MRPVPGAAIGVDVWVGRFGERAVDLAPLLKSGGAIDRRPNQRMTEHHSRTGGQQVFRFDYLLSRLGDSEPPGSLSQQRRIAQRVCCGHQQKAPRIVWKRREASGEALLDTGGQGHQQGQTKPAGELRRRQPSRQLEHSERVPARLDDDPLQHTLIQRTRQDGLQQSTRITMPQGVDVELWQTGKRVARISCREHERELLRQETASHERKHLCRSTIQPLRIVNDGKEQLLLRRLRQQAEDRQSDQERIRSRPAAEPERDAKRVTLGLRQVHHEVKNREAQLLGSRVRELHLRLDPERPGDPKLSSRPDRILKQRGLANPRLSTHHQDTAVAAARSVQQPVERPTLALPTEQLQARHPDLCGRSAHLISQPNWRRLGSRTMDSGIRSGIRSPGSGATMLSDMPAPAHPPCARRGGCPRQREERQLNTPVSTTGTNLAFVFIGGQPDPDSVVEYTLAQSDHVSVPSPPWLS